MPERDAAPTPRPDEAETPASPIPADTPRRRRGSRRALRPVKATGGALASAWEEYNRHDGMLLASGLAFHGLLSAAPLLVFAVAVAGALFGREAATGELGRQLRTFTDPATVRALVRFVESAGDREIGGPAALVSLAVLLFASSRFFVVLQSALNLMFDVRARTGGKITAAARRLLLRRALSFGMVLLASAFLLASLVVKVVLNAFDAVLAELPGWAYSVPFIELGISIFGLSLSCAAVFKFLPDVDLEWRDSIAGGALTAALVTLGGHLVSAWIVRAGTASSYGAAGSVVLFLLWAYYSSQIFFFGAQLTAVIARRRGATLTPHAHAVALREHDARGG